MRIAASLALCLKPPCDTVDPPPPYHSPRSIRCSASYYWLCQATLFRPHCTLLIQNPQASRQRLCCQCMAYSLQDSEFMILGGPNPTRQFLHIHRVWEGRGG